MATPRELYLAGSLGSVSPEQLHSARLTLVELAEEVGATREELREVIEMLTTVSPPE